MANTKIGRVGMSMKGEYSSTTQYEKLDVVLYKGVSYCAISSVKGIIPTDTTKWTKMTESFFLSQDTEPVEKPYLWLDTSQAWIETSGSTTQSLYLDSTLTDSSKAAPANKVGELSNSIENLKPIIASTLPTASQSNHCRFAIITGNTDKLYINLKLNGEYKWFEFGQSSSSGSSSSGSDSSGSTDDSSTTDTSTNAILGTGKLGTLVLGRGDS